MIISAIKQLIDLVFFLFLCRYGNTHSETSLCAQQSTKFREEARQIIKKSVNANENDVLLFTGSGSTGAVHTLADNFQLHDRKIRENTVIIISAFEHHSNILPWQETGVEVTFFFKRKLLNIRVFFFFQRWFVFLRRNKVFSIDRC